MISESVSESDSQMPQASAPGHTGVVGEDRAGPVPQDPDDLAERYAEVRERVAEAARRAGRSPDRVVLIAVTKYAHTDDIRRLIELGHRDFGESRPHQLGQRAAMIDEWFSRLDTFAGTSAERDHNVGATDGGPGGTPAPAPDTSKPVRWHLIGHLQRNKAKRVAPHCRLIHSLDSLRLAEELQTLAARRETVTEVLIQVNCSGEDAKRGCLVPAVLPLAEQMSSMFNLRIRGLMTMAPYSDDPEASRPVFARCRELFEELVAARVCERFNLLSMGMTGDYEVAISEGANLVRIGSAMFGDHPGSDPLESEPDPEAESEADLDADAESEGGADEADDLDATETVGEDN